MKPTLLSPFLMFLTFSLLLPPLMGSFLFKGRSNPTKTSHKSAPSPSLESSYSFTNTENTTQVPEHAEIALKDSASEKPGQCPMDFLPCKELCHGDDSCPHGQKCCSTGCGHTCQGNIERGRSGHCPFILQNLCMTSCKTDENCPRREKCCKSGCGQLCVAPLLTENSTQIPEEEPSPKNFTEIPISEVPPVPEIQVN